MNQELIGELYTRHNFQMHRSCYNSCTMWSQWCNCQTLGCHHSFPKFHASQQEKVQQSAEPISTYNYTCKCCWMSIQLQGEWIG